MNRRPLRRTPSVSIVVILLSAAMAGCTLIGLGIGAAVDKGKHDIEVAGWQFQEVKPGTRIDLILRSGETVSGTYLDRGAADNHGPTSARAPAAATLRLLVADEKLSFATDDVALVRIRADKTGKKIGTLVGLGVDAALVIAAVNALSEPWEFKCQTYNCNGSCPFVYSYDGHGYTLEGEMFGGAIFEATQRSDRVRFERLVARQGEYRIRLANHNHEIQQVDQVQLLFVDHPEGTEILPTLGGELVSFTDRVKPVRAVDLRGANAFSLVRDDDGDSWISTPFGRDPHDPSALRDGLVLEFPRPPGSQTVKLAFTVQSTRWAAGLLNNLVGLQGRDIDAWRDRMNAQPAERMAFMSALRREGLLRLSVWDGLEWRDSGVLANVGPAAPRRQAVRLDLPGVPGSTLRVRLDATPGMWTVDAVAADYSADLPSSVRRPELVRATSHEGRDLRGVLTAVDGRYYTMPTTRDTADLVFKEASPPAPGQRRAFIFEANGYYSILVPAIEPRLALFDRLVSTPGAFARYSLGLAAGELVRAQAALSASSGRATEPRAGKR